MRRRNKPRVVWLPVANGSSVGGNNTSVIQFITAVIAPSIAGATDTVIELPIVQDGLQSDPLDATASLADIENSGYRLRRIVGKVWVLIGQTGQPATAQFIVTAGFMVRRVSGIGDSATPGTSLAASGTTLAQGVHPANISNSMDPWIWRRSWQLANNGSGGTQFGNTPGSNFGHEYPGPLEGPHVDQKTARIVGPEERLFLDVGVTDLLGNDVQTSLIVITDLRVLASMRTNIGNRRNASR